MRNAIRIIALVCNVFMAAILINLSTQYCKFSYDISLIITNAQGFYITVGFGVLCLILGIWISVAAFKEPEKPPFDEYKRRS